MDVSSTLTRGRLLRLTATAAIGAAVSATVQAPPAALAQMTYREAPDLAQKVAAGQLPPVESRLPVAPYLVPHKWVQQGNYGGTMRIALQGTNDIDPARRISNFMYGHSPLRWLNDGTAVGPGLVQAWESNADASIWTFHLRPGVRWSDGTPMTADDIIFWWEDEVQVDDLHELPPDEARSGKGTLATFTKLDNYTFQMAFDAPAPLTADRMAMWVKRDPLGGGGRWIDPKHYLQQYHIKYNAGLEPANWTVDYLKKREHRTNPECPVLTGWKLESIVPAQKHVYARNPYYWAVDSSGAQLPYLDRIEATIMTDNEVLKLAISNGQADFMQGNMAPHTLSDIESLRQAEPRTGMEIRFWDSGSGTGQMYFFNQTDKNPKFRALVQNPTFQKALSMAFNRANIQKAIYFGTGELTTGTLSPKAVEYHVPGGEGVYSEWRDAAVRFDPDRAKAMLDSIGVIDRNRDGLREYPDGSPLEVTLDYGSNASSEPVRFAEFLASDWTAIGVKTSPAPRPENGNAFDDAWEAGKYMTRTNWEVGDGPNHLVYPQWLVPIERQRWAPLYGNWYGVKGTPKEGADADKSPWDRTPMREQPAAGSPVERIWALYDQSKVEPDPLRRHQLVWDMIKIHIADGPFFVGSVANPPRIVLVKKGLQNVPQRQDLALGGFVNPWIHPTPAVYDPETWFWDNPAAHQ